jgi:hypothetical protein
LKAGASQIQSFLLKLEVAPRNIQSQLAAAQFHIVSGNLGQQAHHRIVARLDCYFPFCGGRFERSVLCTEEVDFP